MFNDVTIIKGDRFTHHYAPKTGMTVKYRSKASGSERTLGVVKGLQFKKAFVGMFLGSKPIQAKLKNVTLVFKVKTGKDGKMFGTITAKQIESELLNKHKITIDKRKFVNYEPINRIGESQVAIELDKNIIGTITVQVEEQ